MNLLILHLPSNSLLKKFPAYVLLLALAFSLTGCETMQAVDKSLYSATRKTPTGARFDFSTRQKEIQDGEKIMSSILGEAKAKGRKLDTEAVDEGTYQRAVNIAKNIIAVTPYANENWTVRVIDDPSWNAFTTGGTSITFNAGLLKSVNDCELGVVAGHEIAHVIMGHVSKRQTTQMLGLLTRHTKEVKGLQPFYTTQNEEEADHYGLLFAALAGYDPSCAPALWEKMFSTQGNSAGNYMYDHPLNSERAQAMTRLTQKYARYFVGDGKVNPQAQTIANAELFGQGKELKPGEGGGLMRTLQAVMDAKLEYAKAQAEQSKRSLLALRQQNILGSLQFLGSQKNGDEVMVSLANTSYSRINDVFSLALQIKQGSGEPIRVVRQINGGIQARSKFSVLFKDPKLEDVYYSPADVSVGVDSVIEVRY